MTITAGKMAEALYVHVPFCRHICAYCDFAHTVYRREDGDAWLKAIEKELAYRADDSVIRTVYLGGGTPSALAPDQLERLLQLLDPYIKTAAEATIEVNPETVTPQLAGILVKHGINRISMGMQSSSDALLKAIGRRHTFADTVRAVKIFQDAGIANISLDLMYSLPSQTMDDLKTSVYDALALKPAHLSLYSLTVEENTVFGKTGVQPLDEDTEADMYEWICRTLPHYGYRQYEISNFAMPGKESRHNLAYWHYDDFIGIGCGASGKDGYMRYDHTRQLKAYIENPLAVSEIPLSKKDAEFEMVMMNLRLKEGMNLQKYSERFHEDCHQRFGDRTDQLKKEGLLEEAGGYLRASERGYEILNDVLSTLMMDLDK